MNVDSKSIAHYFYNRDIKEFNPREIPKSDVLQEQKILSLDSIQSFAYSIIMGDVDFYNKNGETIDYENGNWIPKHPLYKEYKNNTTRGVKYTNVFWKEMSS